jgi:hypothetical protein
MTLRGPDNAQAWKERTEKLRDGSETGHRYGLR